MLKTGEACEILGISKGANKNDIERRYSILIKKHRASVSEGTTDASEQAAFEEITEAYNFLMGYLEPKVEEPFRKPNPLMKKMGIDEKKAKNFFYYYKFHMIIGIVILLVIVFSVRGCVNTVKPDFTTAFVGQISYADTDNLKKSIQTGVPEIKEPGFDGAFLTADGNSEQDYAMQEKAMVLFAAADIDLFVLDKVNFEKYAKQGAFVSLDDIAAQIGADKEANKDYALKSLYDTASHLYGIDISKSSALKNSDILGSEFIVAIPVSCKKKDIAVELVKLLMKVDFYKGGLYMSSGLVIRKELSEDSAKIFISGEIDIYTAQSFKEKLYEVIEGSRSEHFDRLRRIELY